MEFFNRYLRRMDEANDGTDVSGGGGTDTSTTETVTDTSKSDPYKAEIEGLKTSLGQTTKQYQDVLGQVKGMQPQLDLVGKMKALFSPEEKKAAFADGVNLSNVTEAAEAAIRNGELTKEEIASVRQEIAELKATNAAHEYNQAALEMNDIWLDRFDTKQDFENALNLVGKVRPDLEKQLSEFNQGGKTPSVDFLRTVDAVLSKIVLEQMLDTNSPIAKSITGKLARKSALRDSSVMDGDGYTDHAKSKSNGGIEISYQQ